MAEAGIAAYGAAIGVAISLAVVCFALRVYHGDVEEYWTHITPEFCNLLDLYKVYWKSKFFVSPMRCHISCSNSMVRLCY